VRRLLLDADRVPFETLKFLIYVHGFNIGRGPLFGKFVTWLSWDDSLTTVDRLPDDLKAARRACKTWDEVVNAFPGAVFAGRPDEEGDERQVAQDRNDLDNPCFPPSNFEWEPDPVIFSHPRGEHLQSLNYSSSTVENTLECHLMDTAREAEGSSPDTAVAFDDKGAAKYNQKPNVEHIHTGPTTMSPILSSFPCPQTRLYRQETV
jgi:hypothetical protein